ncbi:hypothetical protein HYX10_04135 [Candidatus Woesearchaeota archaeon]|nr:hypothetical protein [Candidatus Woesearchaeota archaeon]
MNKTYLLTRPEHDATTYYLSKWAGETVPYAEKKGIRVLDLHGKRANKREVESMLKSFSPGLVVLNGHGNKSTVTGYNDEPILEAGKNEALLRSKIVYAISCSSAKELGRKSVKRGAISYTGYDDDFIFIYDPNNFSRPLKDNTAKLFLEPSSVFAESMLKGNTVEEACTKTRNLFKENIRKLMASSGGDASSVRYLWWDLRHFISHGDTGVSLL